MIAGVLTAAELALLRTRPQRSELYLAIPTYNVIYTARVNGTPASNDGIAQITFDNGDPGLVLTDVKAGMTLWVGSTAGTNDIGIARIRQDAAGGDTHFHIGTTSEIDFADDQFLTIIDEFGPWARHPYIDPATLITYMDYGIAYTNQHTYGHPVPIMGSHAVLELTGATVTVNFDATNAYTGIGTPASYSYTWSCTPACVIATPNAVSTDITFNATGTYLVKLTIVANYGGGVTQTSVGYRYVIVYNSAAPLITSPILESCEGDFDSGDWSYTVTLYDQCNTTQIRNRQLCFLVSKDWYGNTQQSIGPLVGRENIVAIGWIYGESIRRSNDKGSVSFEVHGPSFWTEQMTGFPTGVDDTLAAATDWTEIQNLTIASGLFHFLYWRTTLPFITDVISNPNTHRLATTYTPAGTIADQLNALTEKVFAKPLCNRYAQMYIEVDSQLVEFASRGGFPIVQTLTNSDWRDEIGIERHITPEVSQVDLSGVHWTGTAATTEALFALSPGHYFKHYGTVTNPQRYALDSQAEANSKAGLLAGQLNNEYPVIDIPMSSNYRAVDITPRQYLRWTLASGDTPRGISFTNKKLIPRRIEFRRDADAALMLTDIQAEGETFEYDSIVGDPPLEPPDPPLPPDPPTPEEPPVTTSEVVVVMTTDQVAASFNFFVASPNWINLDPDGDLATAGTFKCLQLTSGGEAYLATDAADKTLCGIWYCADIQTPSWALVLRTSTAKTDQGTVSATAIFASLIIDSSDAVWTCLNEPTNPDTTIHWWTGSAGVLNHSSRVLPNPFSALSGAREFGFAISATNEVLVGLGATYDAAGAVYDLVAGTLYKFTFGVNNTRDVPVVGTTYKMGTLAAGGITDNLYTPMNSDVAEAWGRGNDTRPIVEQDGYTFWTRYDGLPGNPGDLMIDGAVQAIPNDAGGVDGVFSTADAVGGAYICIDTYGHIAWVAHSDHTLNSRRSIAYTEDGGITWQTKDGDFAAVIGDWSGGTAESVPIVRYLYIG